MDQYRVYGNPISQSRSPFIHQLFASQTQQPLNYLSELVALDSFANTVRAFAKSGGKGANVTVPFKEQALCLCDQLSSRAQLAGAVNTLTFKEGQILGDNTDGLGLVNDLLAHRVELSGSNILLLGAGGAAKGVVLPLLEQNPETVVVANRTMSKAQKLVEQFNDLRLSAKSFSDVNQMAFDVIINATSASLTGDKLPIEHSLINEQVVCYDMVYGKEDTAFLAFAKQHHAKQAIDGLGMLVGQAAESFYIWRGVKPEVSTVLSQLRTAL
ncbi:shikimate dehydrogenase (NADP(+)) [Thalassotalea insulae]|uniref:Shikimate dehydrogenase (NADP(+)) n=1 Tax=Thalassotalea insulae TaxID=2056778 RepID=A0ABQ6GRF2_9GAMM|nr:shikimate dehydrogenase [Thalassotalea insulae]GLX78525.1 shikimate dehydrogenase (NADP(+)) [Thalassotalea insulae]